ncbi:phosphatidylglycerophosphatase B [Vibrio sp. JCM 19052]|nr:phosphatidylglycerophosphatase B [Vibrio sp. JCM 19052]
MKTKKYGLMMLALFILGIIHFRCLPRITILLLTFLTALAFSLLC